MRHHIDVRSGETLHGPGKIYRPFCSCGWAGRQDFPTVAAAERDGDDHVLAIIQPSDDLDPDDHLYERKKDK